MMNTELQTLYEQDQADRSVLFDQLAQEQLQQVFYRDRARRQRVKELVNSEALQVKEDYFHAAMVFQHGETLDDFWQAHELASKGAELGHPACRWLTAASFDRWLMNQGKPQKYGTQYISHDDEPYRLWDVDPATTDEERAAWNVPPLTEALQRAEELSRKKQAAAPFSGPTPDEDVNTLLLHFLTEVRTILQESLVGFYLYGSLSLGDFDRESSDIDFLIVTTEDLSDKTLEQLRDMHASIAASKLPYAQRLEGSYIPRAALRRYDPDNARHPTIGIDWEFHIGQHGSNWILERYIVREHGAIVYGPSPKTLIDPISPQELREAVCDTLSNFWQAQLTGPEWLRPRDYQAFAVLTMCRALYTLSQSVVVSKPKAAAWAYQALDPKWRPIIEQALRWRHQHEKGDLTETLDFLRFAVNFGKEACKQ